jgi:parallel beta-helix repeat protein
MAHHHRKVAQLRQAHIALGPRPVAASDTGIGGRTYYVSPSGSDSNSGTSPSDAWRTVAQANRAHLNPGDGVLFQGGATFSDDTLMPGWGSDVSGRSQAPVVFGSYGQGKAILPKGIWTKHESYLVFQDFILGPRQGLTGEGDHITLQNSAVHNLTRGSDTEYGIITYGSYYTLRDNTIDHTGDSGMQLNGDHYLVQNNTITNTGQDPGVTYGTHGIYLKAADSTLTGNTITNFRDEGISVRYRDTVIADNTLRNGKYGLAFHQYDTLTATSHWTNNTIANTSIVGIYISPHDIGGSTHENFVISGNSITGRRPAGDWKPWDFNTQSSVSRAANRVQ